jgi:hypothetical protein
MRRKLIIAVTSSAAMICTAPALAQRGGGHGGGPGGPGAGAGGMGSMGGMGNAGGLGGAMGHGGMGGIGDTSGMGNFGSSMRDQARSNSQGPDNASATGLAHANANSVLAGTTAANSVTAGALAGLTVGTTLFSNGMAVGTVQQIRTTGNGSVAVVLVKGTNGGTYAVPTNKLSLSGGTLSTTARFNGINGSPQANVQGRANSQGPMHASATGIAHANSHSVLAGTSAGLTGVSAGMAVFRNGTQLGTVQRVVTNGSGQIVRVLVQDANGRMLSLSPTNLALSGGVLTTTSIRG